MIDSLPAYLGGEVERWMEDGWMDEWGMNAMTVVILLAWLASPFSFALTYWLCIGLFAGADSKCPGVCQPTTV